MTELSEAFPQAAVVITEYQFVSQMSWIVGCLMTFAGSIDADLIKYTPSQWKKMATGKGNIPEDELRNIIIGIYPEAEQYSEHQIDTLGMYLAYEKSGENNVSPSKKPNKRKNSSKNKTDG
jgi:Holliday junction resolvasome RuvABC endonuclease subunit